MATKDVEEGIFNLKMIFAEVFLKRHYYLDDICFRCANCLRGDIYFEDFSCRCSKENIYFEDDIIAEESRVTEEAIFILKVLRTFILKMI